MKRKKILHVHGWLHGYASKFKTVHCVPLILNCFGAHGIKCKVVDKFTVLSWCEQTEFLPLVSTLLAAVLLAGVAVALGWIEPGILLETLTSLLLE